MASPAAGQAPREAEQARPASRLPASSVPLAAAFAVAALLCLGGAYLGLWLVPFVVGAAAGAFLPRARGTGLAVTVLTVMAGAVAGWAIALWIMALDSLPVGATARSIAALAGLPPYAAVAVAVTLLLAALQALAGTWLARAVFPRQVRLPFPGRHPQP